MVAVDERLRNGDHAFDVLGRARLDGRLEAAEGRDIGDILSLGLLRHAANRIVQLQGREVAQCAGIDLVVDVRDVADIGDVVFPINVAQQPEEHIEDDGRPRIADMGIVVNGRAADIEAHVLSVDGLENLLLAGERIVEFQGRRIRHVLLPKGKNCISTRLPGVLSSFYSRDENGRTSEALVDNLSANDAAIRFHGAFYCRLPSFRQAAAGIEM